MLYKVVLALVLNLYFIAIPKLMCFPCFSTSVEEQVSYGGKVVGESAMKTVEDIGNEVIHKYFVRTIQLSKGVGTNCLVKSMPTIR